MWRGLLWVLVTLCLPATLAAQTRVLSGDHNGFTRLVAPIERGADWQLDLTDGAFRFRIANGQPRYDVRRVFELIQRDRLRSLTATPQGFIGELACDCTVTSTLVQDRFVVLDIRAADSPAAPPQPSTAQTTAPRPPAVASAAPAAPAPPIPPPADPGIPLAPTLTPLDLPVLARQPLSPAEQESLLAVQRQLAAGLGAAATQGLLEIAPGASLPQIQRPQLDTSVLAPDGPARSDSRAPPDRSPNNLRITSGLDSLARDRSDAPLQSLTGHSCPEDADIHLSAWGKGSPLTSQIARGRQMLFGEFDRLNRKAALQLVRSYVHFGFGAEALQILRLDAEFLEDHQTLADIAHILEHGHAPADSLLPAYLDCDADIALWAILARRDLTVSYTVDPSAALRALNKLPKHLRRFLAPSLSRRLLAYGDSDAATKALRTVERLPNDPTTDAKLARAEIAIDEGNIETGTDTLRDVIDDNAAQSPEALIQLVDTMIDANQPLKPETADLIAAYAKEHQQGPLGPELRRVHVLALAKSGQFDAAFAALEDLGGRAETDAAIDLRLKLLRELARAASDVAFLEHVFDTAPKDFGRLPPKPQLALAQRVLDLGFAAKAEAVLQSNTIGASAPEYRLLAARIALALQQPRRALALLGEMATQEADQLRADSNQMVGDHSEAARLFAETNQPEAAIRAAWLAEGPAAEQLSDDPLFGPVLALETSQIQPSTEIDGMITRGSEAVAESANAREVLDAFLRAPELAVPDGS